MEGMSMPREFREIEGLMRTQLHCLILPKLRTLTRFSFRRDCRAGQLFWPCCYLACADLAPKRNMFCSLFAPWFIQNWKQDPR